MYLYVILDVRKEAYDAHPSLCLSRVTVNDGRGMRMYDLCSFSCMELFWSIIVFFCLGTRPSQFIEVLNSRVLRPYQHVKHWIKLTMRPGVTWMLLKFLVLVDTADWRCSSGQLVWFSLAFPLHSFSRTCSNSFSRSLLTTIVAG